MVAQRAFDRLPPFVRLLPLPGPPGLLPAPGEDPPAPAALAPGRQPFAQPSSQARQRLQQVQERGDDIGSDTASRAERSACRAGGRLDHEHGDAGHEQRDRQQQRTPQEPEQ